VRYVLREKLLTVTHDFAIYDEGGKELYRVDGKLLSFGNKLSLREVEGREVATIDQKLLSWGPTYEIHRDGQLAAVVKKHLFTVLRYRFTVDVPGPDDLEAMGDLIHRDYTFKRGDRTVAEVSKRWLTLTDMYGVDVVAGEDAVLILASVIVIHLVTHEEAAS
jgi:uncharacterized protein YxjI